MLGAPFVWRYNGIGIAKGNIALIKTVSNAVNQMIADGRYAALLPQWGIKDFGIKKVTLNAEE